jgi:hypothetical protein
MLARAALAWILCASVLTCFAENPRIAAEVIEAEKDRQQFAQSDWWRYYYITTACAHPSERKQQEIALKLVIASTSRQTVLDECTPQKVQGSDTLFRIDISGLLWDYDTWQALIKNSPYTAFPNYLVQRADWLTVVLGDANELQTPFYYQLLFGRIPKDRNDALKVLQVSQQFDLQLGWIEAQSGVSVNGTRWIAKFPILSANGYAWGTRDFIKQDKDHDPLEHPDGSQKHDAEEWIFGLTKKDLKTGTLGALQGYLLTDGAGKLVTRADVRAVIDHSRFRNLTEVRVPGGCYQCHPGLNDKTEDALRSTLEAGVTLKADYKTQQKIQGFNLTNLTPHISRSNEDYAAAIKILCGCTPKEATNAFKQTVLTYDRPLVPARAAWECGYDVAEVGLFKQAIALADSQGAQFPAQIARLAHGLPCPRVSFEPAYKDLNYVIVPKFANQVKPNQVKPNHAKPNHN